MKSFLTLRRHCNSGPRSTTFKPRRKKTGLLLLICHANELRGYWAFAFATQLMIPLVTRIWLCSPICVITRQKKTDVTPRFYPGFIV